MKISVERFWGAASYIALALMIITIILLPDMHEASLAFLGLSAITHSWYLEEKLRKLATKEDAE